MKFILLVMLFSSCASANIQPKIAHSERVYRTCKKGEVEDYQNKACWRHCFKPWFRAKRCELITKPRISDEFEDFVIIHKSKMRLK